MRRSCGPKARVIPVWTMCTPQIRSAIAPPRSTKVKVVFILRAPTERSPLPPYPPAPGRSAHGDRPQNELATNLKPPDTKSFTVSVKSRLSLPFGHLDLPGLAVFGAKGGGERKSDLLGDGCRIGFLGASVADWRRVE